MPNGPDKSPVELSSRSIFSLNSWNAFAGGSWARVVGNPTTIIVASVALQSVLRLMSNVVLARLLAPNVFALVSITTLVLVGIHMVSDVGIAIAALREGKMSQGDEDRLWTMQAARGFGISIVVATVALPVGWLYNNDQLRNALLVLALSPIIDGLKSLFPVLALADRRLLPSTVIELGGRVVSIFSSILIAFVSPTIWSLVIGTLISMVASTIASHLFAGRWPRIIIDRAYISRQWQFARWIQTSSSLTFAGAQIDKAVFPFLFGMSALGVYGIGATLAAMPSQVTQRWSSSIFYPLAVEFLRGDANARAQLIAVRTTMLIYTSVITLAVMAISPPFFLLLYATRYHDAAAIAVILGAGTFFEVAESSLRHLPLVEGTPHYEVWTVLIRMAAFAIGVGFVILTGSGIPGYALSYVGGLAASHLFMLIVCVQRGYVRPNLDLMLIVGLAATGLAFYLMRLIHFSMFELIGEGAVIALLACAAVFLIYQRRGLPSLSAQLTPPVVRAAVEDELSLHIEDGMTYP